MIAAEDRNALWVSDLKCYKQGDRLHGIIATIDIVACVKAYESSRSSMKKEILAHEEIIGVWVGSPNLE